MTNYIASIAQEIFEELGEPSDFSISAIAAWLRRNIGGLNNFLNESFSINDQGLEISPALNDIQKYIFKKMYNVHYFDLKIKSVGSLATTDFVTIKDDIGSVQKVNKNEVLKNYISIRKQEYEELKGLANQYHSNEVYPMQVAGDDTIPGFYGNSRFDDQGSRSRRNNFNP
jgi:hypothetical protein